MFSIKRTQKINFTLIFLILLGLACGSGGAEISPPGGQIEVDEEAADRLRQNFYQALQETQGDHESQLRVTNKEITSLVAKELTQTGRIPLTDPQIWFTNGRIYITGGVKPLGPISFDSIIVATAVVEQGQLVVEVEEAQMGLFDFPEAILESITQTVNEALVTILIDLDITRLEILEGEMFVLGIRAAP